MARPSSATHPVVSVRHLDTGRAVAWCDGQFAGDPALATAADAIWWGHQPVRIGRDLYPMTNGPHGALAAMLAACRGRGEIVHGPPGGLTDGTLMGEPEVGADVPQ